MIVINQIIVSVMATFVVLGAIDKCLGNKFSLGDKFDEGIKATISLIVPMVGFICAAPVLGKFIAPIFSPLCLTIGVDPAMIAGMMLSSDMGGYPLAKELAIKPVLGEFSGVVVGAVLGGCVCFAIPFLLSVVNKNQQKPATIGMMLGLAAMPFGLFISALLMAISIKDIIYNITPIAIFAFLLIVGLKKNSAIMIKGFVFFSKIVMSFATLAFACAAAEELTGVVFIEGMLPAKEGFIVVGAICIVLTGAYPMIYIITRFFNRQLMAIGKFLKVTPSACVAMLTVLANFLPVIPLLKEMDDRGIIFTMAFLVNAGSAFGDYMGFTAGVAKHLILPMLVAKLLGGFLALFFAKIYCAKKEFC